MKKSIAIPDDLYRRAGAQAALRGLKIDDLVAEGLRLVLEAPIKQTRQGRLSDMMKPHRGSVDSRTRDLGSNPKRLKGFGRSRYP